MKICIFRYPGTHHVTFLMSKELPAIKAHEDDRTPFGKYRTLVIVVILRVCQPVSKKASFIIHSALIRVLGYN